MRHYWILKYKKSGGATPCSDGSANGDESDAETAVCSGFEQRSSPAAVSTGLCATSRSQTQRARSRAAKGRPCRPSRGSGEIAPTRSLQNPENPTRPLKTRRAENFQKGASGCCVGSLAGGLEVDERRGVREGVRCEHVELEEPEAVLKYKNSHLKQPC